MFNKYMPDRKSIEYLEVKKHLSLLEKNLYAAIQNIHSLTIEMDRLRNALAAKEGFEDLAPPVMMTPVPMATPVTTSNGPAGTMSSSKGRTVKVINN